MSVLIDSLSTVASLIAYAWRRAGFGRDRDREAALASLAETLGLDFCRDPWKAPNRFSHEFFQRGARGTRRFCSRMRGKITVNGHPVFVELGDYEFAERSWGDDAPGYELSSYIVMQLPLVGTPPLQIDAQRGLITSPDSDFARDIAHPRMMEFIGLRPHPDVDIRDDVVCLVDGLRAWPPQEFSRWLAWGRSFLELWPAHLRARYPPRSPHMRGWV